jgi:hypothetical protein
VHLQLLRGQAKDQIQRKTGKWFSFLFVSW